MKLGRAGGLLLALTIGIGVVSAAPAYATSTTLAQRQAILRSEVASASYFWNMFNHRTVAPYNDFNWSTDFCSWSPDKPAGFDFTGPCRRHDFGYRNFKDNQIWNAANKLTIDNDFKADMYAVCATHSYFARVSCDRIADTYYAAVRKLGT